MNKNKYFYFLRSQKDFQRFIESHKIDSKYVKNEVFFEEKFYPIDQNLISNYNVIIITSRMSIKSCINSNIIFNSQLNQEQEVLIVGRESAKLINKDNLKFVANKVEKIIQHIESHIDEYKDKKILYLRGNYITYDIKNHFNDQLDIEEKEIYYIDYHDNFSENFTNDLVQNKISTIAFFSFKSLEQFIQIINENNLQSNCKQITIFVMNERSLELGKDLFSDVKISTNKEIVREINKLHT